MTQSNNLKVTLVAQNQAQKEVTINEAIYALEAIQNRGVKDKDLATPPVSPVEGDSYIVASSPTGTWAGKAKNIAYFNQTWKFIAPNEGLAIWVNDENKIYVYDGTNWIHYLDNIATTSLSFSGGNALNNYTEGTFTPTAYGSSVAGSPTYATQIGNYTRIGRMIFYTLRLKFSNLSTMAGGVRIAGLPFTAGARAGQAVHGETSNMAASTFTFASFVQPSTSEIWLYKQASGGTTTVSVSDITANTEFFITGMYYV